MSDRGLKNFDLAENGDPRVQAALRSLDPEASRPGYWRGFHRAVMAAAERELARRGMIANLTVSDTSFSGGVPSSRPRCWLRPLRQS